MNKNSVAISLIILILAIILGAFGAHGLKKIASADDVMTFEVGVRYQFYISILTLVLALNEKNLGFEISKYLLIVWIGLLMFSGSIFGIVLLKIYGIDTKIFIPFTPLGGLTMILGVLLSLIKLLRKKV